MAWFKKKKKVVDLGERYRKQQEMQRQGQEFQQTQPQNQAEGQSQTPSKENTAGFAMFDSPQAQTSQTSQDSAGTDSGQGFVDLSDSMGEKRKRLAKRIMEMTSKVENLSNQLYHLQQRIEVLERKLDVGRY